MNWNQFELNLLPNMTWEIVNKEDNSRYTFIEGLFEYSELYGLINSPMSWGDFIDERDFVDKCVPTEIKTCNVSATIKAIRTIPSSMWPELANIFNGHLYNNDDVVVGGAGLVASIEDCNSFSFLNGEEVKQLHDLAAGMSNQVAVEVIRIACAFWQGERTLGSWADELTTWPSQLPDRLKDINIKNISTMLRKARNDAGATLADMSYLTGISQGDLCRVESGASNFTMNTLITYCNAMGLSIKIEKR